MRLEGAEFAVEIDPQLGAWFLIDQKSGVRWPTEGTATAGKAKGLEGGFERVTTGAGSVRLEAKNGCAVTFTVVDDGRSLQIQYDGKDLGEIRLLGDFSVLTDREAASVIVPCREGLLIPADSGARVPARLRQLGIRRLSHEHARAHQDAAVPFW